MSRLIVKIFVSAGVLITILGTADLIRTTITSQID
jgi:hypothetical protein